MAAEWPPSFYGQLELVNPLQRSIEIEGLREDRFDMTHGGSGGTREGSGEPHEGSGCLTGAVRGRGRTDGWTDRPTDGQTLL